MSIDRSGRPPGRAAAQTWALIGAAACLSAALRFYFGALPQDPAYHLLADTRICGPIPRAGDVLTNLAILAAGVAGVVLWRRVHVAADERAAYALLVAGMLLTALGSAYYHWAPSDARLVWDRLPMTLVLAALFCLVLADRIDPGFARAAWWPLALAGVASVLWWAWSGRFGQDDLLPYVVVRAGTGLAIVWLLLRCRGRHSHAGWLAAAIALDIAMTVSEGLDHRIFAATAGLVSGHNLKHLLAGALLACILMWLLQRRAVAGGGRAAAGVTR